MAETVSNPASAMDSDLADDTAPARELGQLLRAEEVDTIGKSIALLVQEILLNGFDSVDHADLAARIELILQAMPSARAIVLGMQFAIFEEDYALALDHARLLIEREHELMELARARQMSGAARA